MIYEIAEIEIAAGSEAAFEKAVAQASPLFQSAQGYCSMTLNRSTEFPQRYRLVVGWETIEDHMIAFRESEAFLEWRRLASPHFAAPPRVEHVSVVFNGKD